jgi:3'(2'), 5'-bisphosphate nucleotidase
MDNKTLLTIARTAARAASTRIMSHYGTDTEAHDIIMTFLTDTDIPILSEEAEGHALPHPERVWIVDPLDGTMGFIKQTGDFSTMIALLHHGRPVLAVVDAPVLKEHYYAVRGEGSFLETPDGTTRLTVSDRIIPNLRSVMGIHHQAPYMETVETLLHASTRVTVGSVGIKAGYIGADRGDYYLTRGALGEWDVCAPELILTEAGGTVTDTDGNPLFYGNADFRINRGAVFSNGKAHDAILTALASIEA